MATALLMNGTHPLDKAITFITLNESHIPFMQKWLSTEEVMRWYGNGYTSSEEALRKKYLFEKPEGGTHCMIILLNDQPIGYLQYYRVMDYPDWCDLISGKTGDYGLDLFIGQPDLFNHGLGTRIVKQSLNELIFSNEDAERCVLAPSPDNKRSIRCYEKCGFQHIKTVTSVNEDQGYIMAVERSHSVKN